jgi:hypothetical protein
MTKKGLISLTISSVLFAPAVFADLISTQLVYFNQASGVAGNGAGNAPKFQDSDVGRDGVDRSVSKRFIQDDAYPFIADSYGYDARSTTQVHVNETGSRITASGHISGNSDGGTYIRSYTDNNGDVYHSTSTPQTSTAISVARLEINNDLTGGETTEFSAHIRFNKNGTHGDFSDRDNNTLMPRNFNVQTWSRGIQKSLDVKISGDGFDDEFKTGYRVSSNQLASRDIDVRDVNSVLVSGDAYEHLKLSVGTSGNTFIDDGGHGIKSYGEEAFSDDFWVSLVIGEGSSQYNPIMPDASDIEAGTYFFNDAQSGAWFDPEPWDAFVFSMTGDSLFTDIFSFPTDFGDTFEVLFNDASNGWSSLGNFDLLDSLNFSQSLAGKDVNEFMVAGIDNPGGLHQFPLQLGFDTPTASFKMQGIDFDVFFAPNDSVDVPEPSTFVILGLGLLGLFARDKRKH